MGKRVGGSVSGKARRGPVRGRLVRAALAALAALYATALIALIAGTLLAVTLAILGLAGVALGLEGDADLVVLSVSGLCAVILVSVLSFRMLLSLMQLCADGMDSGRLTGACGRLGEMARCSAACAGVLALTQMVWWATARQVSLNGLMGMTAAFAAGYAALAGVGALLCRARF